MSLNQEQYKINDTEAHKRLLSLFDEGSFTEIDAYAKSADSAVEVVAGFGSVYGTPVYAFSQDVSVDGGAISKAQGAKIKKIYELATKTGAPVVGVYDSNGVKLTEGMEALAAYGDMLKLSNDISGVVPQVAVIAGPCIGTSALVAAAADIVIMAKDAELYLSAPNNVCAEDCLKSGVAALVADDVDKALEMAKDVVSKLPINNLCAAPIVEFTEDTSFLANTCDMLKADTAAVIGAVADTGSVIELNAQFGASVHTALGTVAGTTVGFVGFNGRAVDADSCDKTCRFVRFCDAYNLPVVTLVHTDGFDKTETAEKAGILRQASKLSSAYAEATTVKVSLITGNAIGSAYIALAGRGANADIVYAWRCAVVSALDPEAAVALMYRERLAAGEDREALVAEYKTSAASPMTAAALGQIDAVFVPADTRAKLIATLEMLCGKRVSTLPKKHTVI